MNICKDCDEYFEPTDLNVCDCGCPDYIEGVVEE